MKADSSYVIIPKTGEHAGQHAHALSTRRAYGSADARPKHAGYIKVGASDIDVWTSDIDIGISDIGTF